MEAGVADPVDCRVAVQLCSDRAGKTKAHLMLNLASNVKGNKKGF